MPAFGRFESELGVLDNRPMVMSVCRDPLCSDDQFALIRFLWIVRCPLSGSSLRGSSTGSWNFLGVTPMLVPGDPSGSVKEVHGRKEEIECTTLIQLRLASTWGFRYSLTWLAAPWVDRFEAFQSGWEDLLLAGS